jgi:hypothetical protein
METPRLCFVRAMPFGKRTFIRGSVVLGTACKFPANAGLAFLMSNATRGNDERPPQRNRQSR